MIKNGVFNSEESEGRVKFFGKAIAKSIQVQQEYNDKLQNTKDNLEKLKEEGKTLQSRDFSKKSVNQEEIKQQNINSLASTQKKDFDKLIENYPYSKLSSHAEIMAAYSLYENNEIEKAIIRLNSFIELIEVLYFIKET